MATQGTRKGSAKAESWWELSFGDLLVLVGAIVLLVSLFLNWWTGPAGQISVSAWTALEVADLILAVIAVIAILLVLPAPPVKADFNKSSAAWLPWLGPISLVVIAAALVTDPPSVNGLSLAVGAWIGLGGAIAMTVGGILRRVGLSISISRRS